jgi:hypothetical protein
MARAPDGARFSEGVNEIYAWRVTL